MMKANRKSNRGHALRLLGIVLVDICIINIAAFLAIMLRMDFSMEEAASDERIADIDGLVEVKSGEETTFKDLSEHKHLHLIYTDSSVRIQTNGKIMYYSKNVSLVDDHTVQTSDDPSVILFK